LTAKGFFQFSLCLIWTCFITCFLTLSAFANDLEETDIEETGLIGDIRESVRENLDSSRSTISSSLFSITDSIDALFDDVRADEQRQFDRFRLGSEVRFRAASPIRLRQRFSASFNFDNISDRFRLVVDGSKGDEVNDQGSLQGDRLEGNDVLRRRSGSSSGARFRYSIYNTPQGTLVDVDAGVRFSSGITPITRIRASHWFQLSDLWAFEPTQTILWDGKDGYGESQRLDFNRIIGERAFFRSRSEKLWSETSRGLEFFQEFSAYKELSGERRSLGVSASISAHTRPDFLVDQYRLSVRYKNSIYQDWLFLEVEPGLDFPEDRDYRRTPFVMFRFDMFLERHTS